MHSPDPATATSTPFTGAPPVWPAPADAVEITTVFDGAILEVRHLHPRGERSCTVGTDPSASMLLPEGAMPAPLVPLVLPPDAPGAAFSLIVPPGADGELTLLGDTRPFASWRTTLGIAPGGPLPLLDGARARVELSGVSFFVSATTAPTRAAGERFAHLFDLRQQGYTAFVLAGVAMFLGLIFAIPPDPSTFSGDAFSRPPRLTRLMIQPLREEEPKPEPVKAPAAADNGSEPGKAEKGPGGVAGSTKSKEKTGHFAIKGDVKPVDVKLAKEYAVNAARDAGMIGILKTQRSVIASLFSNESAVGGDAQDIMAGLIGTQHEASGVPFGTGLAGTLRGGGGTGDGTIGIGDNIGGGFNLSGTCLPGQICSGGAGRRGGGGPGRDFGLRGKKTVGPEITLGVVDVTKGIDASMIRRVVRSHMHEVRFCYERELVKAPELWGRVLTKFTIGGTGDVVASFVAESSLKSPPVEHCVSEAIRRWNFPRAPGGPVIVTYPFAFKHAGSE